MEENAKNKDIKDGAKSLICRLTVFNPKKLVEFYKIDPKLLIIHIFLTLVISIVSGIVSGWIGAIINFALSIILILTITSPKIKYIKES